MYVSSTEKYIDLLKLQALTADDLQAAKEAISTLELYGYRAVPALRDLLESCTSLELKGHARDVLARLGWILPPSAALEDVSS